MGSRKKLKHLFIRAVLFVLLLLWFYSLPQKKTKLATEPTATRLEETASLIAVNNTKTLLISAYLEHRTDKKKVRVIAVVKRSEEVAYRCLLCCQEQIQISEGSSSIHRDHFGFEYGTADIMCPLPAGCKTPSHIAVTSAAAMFEVESLGKFSAEALCLERAYSVSTVLADVDDDCSSATLQKNKLKLEFLEIENQKAEMDSFPYNFTVCLSTMFDFSNVLQLVQNLEILRLLGVNRAVLYKTNCSAETQRVLDYYTQKGFLEVIPWSMSKFLNVSRHWKSELGPGDLHYYGQIPALNDCVYRNMYQSKYVAMIDTDELILPQTVNSWLELLPLLEQKYGAKCYKFENSVFPINVALPPPSPHPALPLQDHWKSVPGVNILAHLHHEPVNSLTRVNFKVIVSPRVVFATSVHGLLDPEYRCTWVDKKMARLYHTRALPQIQVPPDQLIYDGRLMNYNARLVPAVDAVLRESGLLPVNSWS